MKLLKVMPISSSLQATVLVRRFHKSATRLARDSRRIVAIRREDASIWERRAPLAPFHVEKLTKSGVRILIQPSNRRAYPLQSYVQAGAEVEEDISEAPVILGVKQVPVEALLPGKTYCFFSHTIKAQEANMPLLDAVLEKNIRLIDYERMVDESDSRVVAFGKYAGVAGMINILHGIGLRLLALGHHTPFMHIGPAHNYRNAGSAKQAIRDTGYEIALGKMPRSIGPLTFVFTGSGNVSQGAREVFAELPIEYVEPSDLKEVAEKGSTSKIYGATVTRSDHLVRKPSAPPHPRNKNSKPDFIDYEEYAQHPDRYYSNFSTDIAPYASVIINGVYWPPNAPRLLTIPDAKKLQQPVIRVGDQQTRLIQSIGSPSLPHRLIALCDISADPGGSIEFMRDCSTIDNPFYLYDADTNTTAESTFAGNGILICSIDNMPTQLPLESTDMFGNLLFPYIMDIVKSDAKRPVEEENYSSVVNSAIIASNGELRPNYKYIQDLRQRQEAGKFKRGDDTKEVLVLGAGHVSGPLVEYLCRDPKVRVTVVSKLESDIERLRRLSVPHKNMRSIIMDVARAPDNLKPLIEESSLVASLLPYSLHSSVAKLCIENKTNMLTASYLSEELKELDQEAKNAGITVLSEVGLDPGIDHLLAKQAIDQVTKQGGRITSFVSYCCGLPTPEFADNPLGYKFGWNPAGAFAITMNEARWKEDDQVHVAKSGSLMDYAKDVDGFLRGFALEAFPNRDSLKYQSLYNLPDAKTIIRGTLRYKGFSNTVKALREIGLMDRTPQADLQSGSEMTWRQYVAELLGHQRDLSLSNLKSLIYEKVGRSDSRLQALLDLGILDDEPIIKCGSSFDTTCNKIIKRYPFQAGENDLIIMRINMAVQWADRNVEEKSLNMIVYGDNGFSAMSKTVGYPAGIAAKMILDEEIQDKGMIMPLQPEIYRPMLNRLREEGIFARE